MSGRRQHRAPGFRFVDWVCSSVSWGFALLTSESKSIGSVDQGIFITVPSQPINVGDAMAAALVYHDSGPHGASIARSHGP